MSTRRKKKTAVKKAAASPPAQTSVAVVGGRRVHPVFGELPDDVEVITIEVPVYKGKVLTDRPTSTDTVSTKFLNVQQRIGINSVFEAILRLSVREEKKPRHGATLAPYIQERNACLRWVFSLIGKAREEVLGDAS